MNLIFITDLLHSPPFFPFLPCRIDQKPSLTLIENFELPVPHISYQQTPQARRPNLLPTPTVPSFSNLPIPFPKYENEGEFCF